MSAFALLLCWQVHWKLHRRGEKRGNTLHQSHVMSLNIFYSFLSLNVFALLQWRHSCRESHCRDVALFHGICGNCGLITAYGNSPSYVVRACLLTRSVDRRVGAFQMHVETKLQIPYHMQRINIWLSCSHRCLRLLIIDNYWSFMSQKHNMIMRDAIAEGSENLDHLGLFNMR